MSDFYPVNDTTVEQYVTTTTAQEALQNKNFRCRFTFSVIMNFLMNVGMTAFIVRKYDILTLYHDTVTIAYDIELLTIFDTVHFDLGISTFLTVFLSTVLGRNDIMKVLDKGKVTPIDPSTTRGWKYFGVHIPYAVLRGLLCGIVYTLTLYPIFLLFLHWGCHGGIMHSIIDNNNELECFLYSWKEYIWIKSAYVVFVYILIAPIAEIGALLRPNITDKHHKRFLISIGLEKPETTEDLASINALELETKEAIISTIPSNDHSKEYIPLDNRSV